MLRLVAHALYRKPGSTIASQTADGVRDVTGTPRLHLPPCVHWRLRMTGCQRCAIVVPERLMSGRRDAGWRSGTALVSVVAISCAPGRMRDVPHAVFLTASVVPTTCLYCKAPHRPTAGSAEAHFQ